MRRVTIAGNLAPSRVMRPEGRRYGSERAGISQAPAPVWPRNVRPGPHGGMSPAAPDARKVWVSG